MAQQPAANDRFQTAVNDALWEREDLVGAYANRELRPGEVMLLVRNRDDFTGRVLELGCGAGRLTGYLIQLGGDVHATDVNQTMLDQAARQYPGARYERLDMRELGRLAEGSYDTVLAGFGVIDVLDDAERGRVLDDIHRLLAPGGAFIFSTH